MIEKLLSIAQWSVPYWICSSFLICTACGSKITAVDDPDLPAQGIPTRIKIQLGVPTVIPVLNNDKYDDVVGSPSLRLDSAFPVLPKKGIVSAAFNQAIYTATSVGTDEFSYVATDTTGSNTDTATVYIEVEGTPSNDPPVAVDDTSNGDYFIVPHQVSQSFDVLANDDGKGQQKILLAVDLPGVLNNGLVEVPASSVGQFDMNYVLRTSAGSDIGLLKVKVEPSAGIFFQNQSNSDIKVSISGRTLVEKTISSNQSELAFFVPNDPPALSQVRVERLPTLHPTGVTSYEYSQAANSLTILKYTEAPHPLIAPN